MTLLRASRTGTALAVMLSAGLAGCGFQLRGAPPVSSALEPLAVECAQDVPEILCESVRDQLELGEVALSATNDAAYIMTLSRFQADRRASAITVDAAAAEYTLRHSIALELVSADKVPMIANTRLTSTESYRYDDTNVLAKQREEEELRTQLSDRLAQQIIFRLAPLTEARLDALREEYEAARTNDSSRDAPAQ